VAEDAERKLDRSGIAGIATESQRNRKGKTLPLITLMALIGKESQTPTTEARRHGENQEISRR
jgi:hypothetical protein